MKKSLFFKVWIGLILLTILSAAVSNGDLNYSSTFIIILAGLKFIGITFYFMELKKAHVFWKVSILMFLVLFSIISLSFL